MLALLWSLFGISVAGAAAGGGGGSNEPEDTTVEVVGDPRPDVVVPDDAVPDHGGHMGAHEEPDRGSSDHDDDHDDMDHGGHTGGDAEPDRGSSGDDDSSDGGADHGSHGDHDDHGNIVDLPKTPAEVEAFVAAVRASPETHSHDMASSMAGEHMAAMDLVPRDEATHIAIGNGDWNDPANWYNGLVPGDDAAVLIPEGVHMTYQGVHDARLFTLRVDGHLDFEENADSRLVVDTFVVTPSGKLTIGTADAPIDTDVNVEVVFANNGAIDTDWDPLLLSRGLIAHGEVEIHGAEKDSHNPVTEDPMKGDTWIDFAEQPQGWEIGDTITIAGTHYEGYFNTFHPASGYIPPQDEERVITDIQDGRVFFNEPLIYDHDAPRDDLKTSVANYTRNVSFETENAATAEVYERGHVMFMHNDDVDVRYAEFHELGRTDKSETALNAGEFDDIAYDSNVKGRYSFHFHRAGVDDEDDPGMAVGNAVYGSPGWGFVHHDSHAIFDNNATYDTFGAGYVSESGNETGAWTDNIAIYAQGVDWRPPKFSNDTANFDLGKTGDGFWFQSRMVDSVDNIAASVNHGFVYFHRGGLGEDKNIIFDSEISEIEGALKHNPVTRVDEHPILSFDGNETFASKAGLWVVKANPNQGHDVHSVLEDFTAWNVRQGAFFEYTSHYVVKDFDIVGSEPTNTSPGGEWGIGFGTNTTDMTIINPEVENFDIGINLFKDILGSNPVAADDNAVIDAQFRNVGTEYLNYDPSLDTITSLSELPFLEPDIRLDGPLTFTEGNPSQNPDARILKISGTKTDSLGETRFPAGMDDYSLNHFEVHDTMVEKGYYTTSDGQDYFLLDLYFSDRLTGDIFQETHPVLLDAPMGTGYWKVPHNGQRELDAEDGLASDAAELWATLTDGELVLQDQMIEDPAPEDDIMMLQ